MYVSHHPQNTLRNRHTAYFFIYISFLFIYLFLNFIYLFIFIYGCVGSSFLCEGFSLVAASGDHSSSLCVGLSLSWPVLLRSTGSRRAGSIIVAHGPSCSAACGIFPDQGSNPCPLHWQADSQPLRHQGSPTLLILIEVKHELHQLITPPTQLRDGWQPQSWALDSINAFPKHFSEFSAKSSLLQHQRNLDVYSLESKGHFSPKWPVTSTAFLCLFLTFL